MDRLARKVFRRFSVEEAPKVKPKRMVVMIGPPAAGKGFFLGEPKADKPGTKYGWKFPDSTHGLFTKEDIPQNPEYDESDRHLRAIQYAKAEEHYSVLADAHKKGQAAYEKAVSDMWYETKDGKRVELGKVVSFDDFPDTPKAFHKKAERDFYVSMRGWHDDAKTINKETGKPTERFKDEARHHFDDAINEKLEKDNELLIVDSAGEDIDAQDYEGQIATAKANGYDVTVVFLHPEQADTELSNLARGKVAGKRMVDQADIDNWYAKNQQALESIQKANPTNFLHYRKPPPDPDPAKAAAMRKEARDLMNSLPPPPIRKEDEADEDFDKRQKQWEGENKGPLDKITKTLYTAAPYPKEPEASTSYGQTLDRNRVPDKPQGDIAKTVAKMNSDAEERADKFPESRVKPPKAKAKPEEEPKGDGKEEPPKGDGKEKKDDKDGKTQQDFLRDVGDKLVPNPNPQGIKKQIKIRSLPWADQKQYYDQWSSREAMTRRVVGRYKESTMRTAATIQDWLGDFIREMSEKIESGLKLDDYDLIIKPTKTSIVYVIAKGAEGDTKAMREGREKIDGILKGIIEKKFKGEGFRTSVSTSNKGDDLYFTCEIIFP
jgi:hypothetical protein